MAITPDGATLLVAETSASRVTSFAIGSDGTLGARRTRWGSRWSWGRGGASTQSVTSPPAEPVEGQRSELPVVDRHISD
jgi:hypothetical protein